MIEGVNLYPLKHINVPKGDIFHVLKSTDDGYVGFGEAYFSLIKAGEIKGWKKHNRLTLNIVVIVGAIKFIIYDDRVGSKTYGKFEEVTLSPNHNYQRLMVEPGLWMAFQGMAENKVSILLDIIPEPHDPTEACKTDLLNIKYNF